MDFGPAKKALKVADWALGLDDDGGRDLALGVGLASPTAIAFNFLVNRSIVGLTSPIGRGLESARGLPVLGDSGAGEGDRPSRLESSSITGVPSRLFEVEGDKSSDDLASRVSSISTTDLARDLFAAGLGDPV